VSSITAATGNLTTLNSTTINNTGNASIGGTLGVTGNTNLSTLSTSGLATLNSANVTNNLSVGGTSSLSGKLTANNGATINGGGSITSTNGTNSVVVNNAGTTITGALNINGSVNMIGSGASSNTQSSNLAGAGTGTVGQISVNTKGVNGATESSAEITLTNGYGNTHGLQVYEDKAVLSGGTHSTTLTLDDSGATFQNSAGSPVRVTGVADGSSDYDAVNYRQLKKAYSGIASASALAAIPSPVPGKNFSLGVGYGHFEASDAFAIGGKAIFGKSISADFGVGLSDSQTTVNAGLGYSF
jgi:hypothetical protein